MFLNQNWKLDPGDRGVLSPGRFLPVRAIGWSGVLFLVALFFFFATLYQFAWLHLPDSIWVGILGPVAAFIAYGLLVKAGERRTPVEALPSRSTLYELVVGFGIGFAMISATLALLWSLGLYHVQLSHLRNWFAFFVSNAYISGTLEELAFRAILLRLFARAFGPGWGLALSAAAFGAAHLSHATWLAAFEIAFNGGLILGLVYMATGRLWMSIGLHIGWDFTEGAILGVDHSNGLLLSTPVAGKPDILTGGTYGPDASLLATLVGAVFIAAILYANCRGLFSFNQRPRLQ